VVKTEVCDTHIEKENTRQKYCIQISFTKISTICFHAYKYDDCTQLSSITNFMSNKATYNDHYNNENIDKKNSFISMKENIVMN
jgi:hypothetical protein